MLQSIARVANYGALALAFLLYAIAAYGAGAVGGGLIGAALSLVPLAIFSPLSIDVANITLVLCGAGALIGAGYGLILMWRVWITYLQMSSDENLRSLGNYFDELRHAIRHKP